MTRQVLFVLGPQTCVPGDPLRAARGLGCRTILMGPDCPGECDTGDLVDRFEQISLARPDQVVALAEEIHRDTPIDAVIGYDDDVMLVVARIAERLGLRSHSYDAAVSARDKPTMKQRFMAAGIPIAPHHVATGEEDAVAWANGNGYPVVVKPVRGGASQGVIRADDEEQLRAAYRRLHRLVRNYGLDQGGRPVSSHLVEKYLDGDEVSVDVVAIEGELHVVGICEKPHPLRGPFFEETIYVTEESLSPEVRAQVRDLAVRAGRALGLTHGPGHCEIRLTDDGPFVLEMAARLIGASCPRVFSAVYVEDIHRYLLKLALGDTTEPPRRRPDAPASGAMMFPIPGEGRIARLVGVDEARAVRGVSDVNFTVGAGDVIVPFPEQTCYIGLLEAQGRDTQDVVRALKEAQSKIRMELGPVGCDLWTFDFDGKDCSYRAPGDYQIRVLEGDAALDAYDDVVKVLARSMFDELPTDEAIEQARCTVDYERPRYGRDARPMWILADGVGVLLPFVAGETAYITCGGVVPDHRRGGLGEALFRTQLAELQARGVRRLVADVDPRLPLLPRLLRKLGFDPPERPGAAADDACCCSCG